MWALDNWTRTLNVTVENQVNNSHCNGAPACYAVFGTITDSGTSVAQDGKAAPNNVSQPRSRRRISEITLVRSASFLFYVTSDAIGANMWARGITPRLRASWQHDGLGGAGVPRRDAVLRSRPSK